MFLVEASVQQYLEDLEQKMFFLKDYKILQRAKRFPKRQP
jgi:hypothetical protein